jgi:hypothetical protein
MDLQLLGLIGPGVEKLMQQIAAQPKPIAPFAPGASAASAMSGTSTAPTTPTQPTTQTVPNQIPRAEPARG